MRVLSVGLEVDHEALEIGSFKSSTSFLNYDIVLWNPNEVSHDYKYDPLNSSYKGLKLLSTDDSVRAQVDIERRRKEQDLRTSYREKKRKYLEETDWQYKLFDEMLFEVEKKNTPLFLKLYFKGAPEPILVLDKYFVGGKRVTGVIGHGVG